MLQVTQLSKTYGDRVLFHRVTWQIGRRDRIGLCGPNGAGKTTLMRILVGAEEPDAGRVVRPTGATVEGNNAQVARPAQNSCAK